jgi:polyhydroxyalkanoate synthesis regulator protein
MHGLETSAILIKRCAGHRLYDVDLGRYVIVDDLYAWQLMAISFIVRDATSGEDVTATVLAEPDFPSHQRA